MQKVGVCCSLEDVARLAGKIDFFETRVLPVLMPESPDEPFRKVTEKVRETAVPMIAANCFLPADLKVTGADADMDRLTTYAIFTFQRAREIGIKGIVFGSGKSRKLAEGFNRTRAEQQFVDALKTIGPIAGENGVIIYVEPLNASECNLINSLAEGAELVMAADHPNIKLLADLYHMAREDEDASEIERFGNIIRHVHLAEKENRTAPGVMGDDFRPYLKALAKVGYNGPFSLECRWTDMVTEAVNGVAELRRQLEESQ